MKSKLVQYTDYLRSTDHGVEQVQVVFKFGTIVQIQPNAPQFKGFDAMYDFPTQRAKSDEALQKIMRDNEQHWQASQQHSMQIPFAQAYYALLSTGYPGPKHPNLSLLSSPASKNCTLWRTSVLSNEKDIFTLSHSELSRTCNLGVLLTEHGAVALKARRLDFMMPRIVAYVTPNLVIHLVRDEQT